MPPWWHGKQCDTGNYPGSHPLGAVFFGLVACGPGPTQGGSDHPVRFAPDDWGELEWECVELSMRWMDLAWGVNPYPANGNDVAADYASYKKEFNAGGPDLRYVANGTKGVAPLPGDVLSYSEVHTSVVTGSSVDSAGNGTITVIEDNGGPGSDGWNTLPVTGWVVGDTVTGWLHEPGFILPVDGYWLAASSGSVAARGAAPSLGGTRTHADDPLVSAVATPDGKGYWLVTGAGGVSAFGNAAVFGRQPAGVTDVVGIAPTPDGKGYWLATATGAVYPYGDARSYGSLPALGVRVNDVVGIVAAPAGKGYLLVGADGGVFCFGKARYLGSLPGLHVRVSDIRAIVPAPDETGYLLVGADGGAFAFGSGDRYFGSLPGRGVTVHDIVSVAMTPDGGGYWMVGADGDVFGFGDGQVFAVPAGSVIDSPIVAVVASAPS
jgi:hypothetical protein